MCIECEMHDKWPPFIEFMVWFILMAINIGGYFGVWLVVKSKVVDVTGTSFCNATRVPMAASNLSASVTTPLPPLTCINNTYYDILRQANRTIQPKFLESPDDQWSDLLKFRSFLLIFNGLGAGLFVLHIAALLPNIIQSCRVPDPVALKEGGNVYFSNLLKIHCVLLILESILFDIPASCFTMELLAQIWDGPTQTITDAQKMDASKFILGLALVGLAFIALYKGMMPLFLWIGNPFCFPCIPLRLLVVLPGGLIALVMTFAPAMGVAKNRLLTLAPPDMEAQIGEVANTFFSIGMIFWGVFGFVMVFTGFCWYKFCREGADADVCSVCC